MSAAVTVATRLGLSVAAVAAFTGQTAKEFAQHFGVSLSEGEWALSQYPLPDAPATAVLTVTAADDWEVTWTPPAAGAPVEFYKVQYTPLGGSLTTVVVEDGLTYAGTDVLGNPDDTVAVFVRASNIGGDGPATQSNGVTIPTPP
jgi:hypothetical protein